MKFTTDQIKKINKLRDWMRDYNADYNLSERSYRYGKNALRRVPLFGLNVQGTVEENKKSVDVYYTSNASEGTDYPKLPDGATFFTSKEVDPATGEYKEYKDFDYNLPPLDFFKLAMDFVLDVANLDIDGAGVITTAPSNEEEIPLRWAVLLQEAKTALDTAERKTPRDDTAIEAAQKSVDAITKELDIYSDDIVDTFQQFRDHGGFAPMEALVEAGSDENEKGALKFINDVQTDQIAKTTYSLENGGIRWHHRGDKGLGWSDFIIGLGGLALAVPFVHYLFILVGAKGAYDRLLSGNPPPPPLAYRLFKQAGLNPPSLADWTEAEGWYIPDWFYPIDLQKDGFWPTLRLRVANFFIASAVAVLNTPRFVSKVLKAPTFIWIVLAESIIKLPMSIFKAIFQYHRWPDKGPVGTLKAVVDGIEGFAINVLASPAIFANHAWAALVDAFDQAATPINQDPVIELFDRWDRRNLKGGKDPAYSKDKKGNWLKNGKPIDWKINFRACVSIVMVKIGRVLFDTIPMVLSRGGTNTLRSIVEPLGISGKKADSFWEGFRISLYSLLMLFEVVVVGWYLFGGLALALGASGSLVLPTTWLGTMFTGIGAGIATLATGVGAAASAIWAGLVGGLAKGILFLGLDITKTAVIALASTGVALAFAGIFAFIYKSLTRDADKKGREKVTIMNDQDELIPLEHKTLTNKNETAELVPDFPSNRQETLRKMLLTSTAAKQGDAEKVDEKQQTKSVINQSTTGF